MVEWAAGLRKAMVGTLSTTASTILTLLTAIVENQLQAQIIQLQQTVINVLQDALYNDRQLTRADMAKLIAASNQAREGSMVALQEAQQRLGGSQAGGGEFRPASPARSCRSPASVSASASSGR